MFNIASGYEQEQRVSNSREIAGRKRSRRKATSTESVRTTVRRVGT